MFDADDMQLLLLFEDKQIFDDGPMTKMMDSLALKLFSKKSLEILYLKSQ